MNTIHKILDLGFIYYRLTLRGLIELTRIVAYFLSIICLSLTAPVAAQDRSGMFVCTPKSEQERPIIYAFDGKHLIRDNDLEIPFSKVASLNENLDLYFAFKPNLSGRSKLETIKNLRNFPDLFLKQAEAFLSACNKQSTNFVTFSDAYEVFFKYKKDTLSYMSEGPLLPLNAKCRTPMDELITPPAFDTKDFNHVKLTIDFGLMTVIEENIYNDLYSGLGIKRFIEQRPTQKKFACKSLGVEVPPVDTSRSIVPLAPST